MTILRITDGTTVADLIWNNRSNRKYMLAKDQWAPTIAPRRRSDLGGLGDYEPVVEEITVHVLGDSVAEAQENLRVLAALLDQAERWADGQFQDGAPLTPIVLQYTATGGDVLLQDVIMGRAEGDQTNLISLDATFNSDLQAYMIQSVKLRFTRKLGAWVGLSQTSTTSGSTSNPGVMTATFSNDIAVVSPLKVALGGFPAGLPVIPPGYIIVSNNANAIQIVDDGSISSSIGVTTADAAKKAFGGNVLRFSAADTVSLGVSATLKSISKHIGIFAIVRNNSLTIKWTLQASTTINLAAVSARAIQIDASSNNPRVAYLGSLASATQISTISINITPSVAGASLDIDYLVLVALDNPYTYIVAMNYIALTGLSGTTALNIDPRPLTKFEPFIGAVDGSTNENPTSYRGDTYVQHRGTTVAALWLATGGSFDPSYWRGVDNAANIISTTLTATRYNSYLTPL